MKRLIAVLFFLCVALSRGICGDNWSQSFDISLTNNYFVRAIGDERLHALFTYIHSYETDRFTFSLSPFASYRIPDSVFNEITLIASAAMQYLPDSEISASAAYIHLVDDPESIELEVSHTVEKTAGNWKGIYGLSGYFDVIAIKKPYFEGSIGFSRCRKRWEKALHTILGYDAGQFGTYGLSTLQINPVITYALDKVSLSAGFNQVIALRNDFNHYSILTLSIIF